MNFFKFRALNLNFSSKYLPPLFPSIFSQDVPLFSDLKCKMFINTRVGGRGPICVGAVFVFVFCFSFCEEGKFQRRFSKSDAICRHYS